MIFKLQHLRRRQIWRAPSTAESGQSIAQAAFEQTVERKKEIEHLHATMKTAMEEQAVATETSTNQGLNALAE